MDLNSNEIQKYLQIIMKRKYLFIAVSLLIMSVIAWGSFFLPKQYEAKSTVFIERSVIKDMVSGITISPSVDDKIRVLKYAMLSREFILKVLRSLDLDSKTKNDKQLEAMIRSFQQRTDINVRGNDLFIVTYRDSDPKIAMDYINALVRKYLEENLSSKREEAYGANKFITEQVGLFKEKLDKAEDAIIKYRQQQGVYMAVDDRALITEIKNYQNELESLKIRRNELSATRNSVKRQLKGEEPFTVAVLSGRPSTGGNNRITAIENRIKELLVTYTENYPEVIKQRAIVESLKKQQTSDLSKSDTGGGEPEMSTLNPIHQDLKQKMLQAESEIEALDAKQKQLYALIGTKEWELRNIPEEKKKLGDLEKDRSRHENVYEQLLSSQGKAEVSKQMEVEDKATTFRIVDPAVLPIKPVSPDRVKLILLGILAGLAGGVGIVLARESLDSSVKDTQTLKSLGVEVLAVIPKIFNEVEVQRTKKRARFIYTVSGLYFLIICTSLFHEAMGFTYIESILAHLGFSI
jgi:polysaccharide biosynthesis transport protein